MLYILLTLLTGFCASGLALSATYYELENATQYFEDFILEYDKHYDNEKEKEARFEIFKENLLDANRLNAESSSRRSGEPFAVYGITEFMDLTPEEFVNTYTGLGDLSSYQSSCKVAIDGNIESVEAPAAFDWRERNVVTKVKHQGRCESCYAFSSTGHLEGQNAIKHKELVELSEQQIVDCDKRSNGCNKGYMSNAFMSVMELGGIMKSSDYPYTAKDGTCRFDRRKAVVKVTSCTTYRLRSQEKLKELLYSTGPISIAVKASNFQKYHGGVFSDRECSGGSVNHAVLLVGYGTDPKQGPYWIIKNSYGSQFGESGYIRVQRGEQAQSCGLMNEGMATATIA